MKKELKEIGNKSAILFSGKIIGEIISFFSVIIIARLLGPQIYGKYVYILSFLTFYNIITDLGLSKGVISFLSRNSLSIKSKKSLLTFSLCTSLLLSIFLVSLSYLNFNNLAKVFFQNNLYHDLFITLLPIVVINTISTIELNSLRAFKLIKTTTLMESIISPATRIIILLFCVLVLDYTNTLPLIISLYVSTVVRIIYYTYILYNMQIIGKIDRTFNNTQILSFSLPLLFSGIVYVLMQNVDKYMIGNIIGPEQVGIYKIALHFGTLSSITLFSINGIFSPIISALHHDGRKDELKKIYMLTTKWIVLINVIIFGYIIIFSKEIMNIAGHQFIEGSTALIYLAISQLINSSVGSVGYMNIMTGNPEHSLLSSFISLLFNVILNFTLIPLYGIEGAAIATIISILVQNSINLMFMYRKLGFQPFNLEYLKIFTILVISVSFAKLLLYTTENIFLRLGVLGSVYLFIISYLIKKIIITKSEMNIIKNKIKKNIGNFIKN